jgi:branched-chain amino acid transport system substrate-binding protein
MVTFQQWDGKQWKVISDWIAPDWSLLRPIIEKASARYADEKGIKPRDCAAEAKS